MWWIWWVTPAIIFFILFCPQVGFFGPYWTIVREGTAKIVLRLGAYKKVLLCRKDHDVDEDGNIIEKPGKKSRGLQRVGLRRIDTLLLYKFRWKDIQLVDGEEKEQFHEVERDWILARPDVYIITIKAAETKVPERIPIDARFAYTLRIGNVRKATLDAPPNWFENVTVRLNSAHRTFIASRSVDDLLSLKEKKARIEKEEIDKKLIKDVMEKNWGIVTEGIEFRDIRLPPIYQEAAGAQRRAEMEAEAEKRRAEIEAFGRAASIMETTVQSLAVALGQSKEVIQNALWTDPEGFTKKYSDIIARTWSGVINKLSMEERSYLRMETPGAKGALGDFLRLIGGWQRMPKGRPEKSKERDKEEKKSEVVDKARQEYLKDKIAEKKQMLGKMEKLKEEEKKARRLSGEDEKSINDTIEKLKKEIERMEEET